MKQKLFFKTNNKHDNPDEIDKVKIENTNNQYKEFKRIHYYDFQRC